MTITHPHHPLRGQQLPIVRVRHGASRDIVVRLPDGTSTAIAISSTDYEETACDCGIAVAPSHLLDLQGLRQMAQLLEQLRQQGSLPASSC